MNANLCCFFRLVTTITVSQLAAPPARAQFTAITNGPVVTERGDSTGCAWADYDNDGNLDLFVSNFGTPFNYLYRNNGDGSFTRVTIGAIATDDANSEGAAWGDYDNDGGASYGCAWGDYDNDGYLDLFVANLNQNNFLYHNNRDGTFTRINSGPIVSDGAASQGCAWGDYDNDGLLDLFVANRNQRNFLYHNEGHGTFTAITNGPVVNDVGYSWSPAWIDYDNDGNLDLFVANGPGSGPGQNNFLYHNNGDGSFTRITAGSVANDGASSDGSAWGDYDNDGFLDLFVSNLNDQNNLLYRNDGNANNWLTVRCVGQRSNRSGIGAKVRLKTMADGQSRWQMREISGGSGYGSQNAPYACFGVGAATNIDIVRLEWPS